MQDLETSLRNMHSYSSDVFVIVIPAGSPLFAIMRPHGQYRQAIYSYEQTLTKRAASSSATNSSLLGSPGSAETGASRPCSSELDMMAIQLP
jgi:hypothetical protein